MEADFVVKKCDFFPKKFGGYEKSRTFALPLKNGWLMRLRVLMKDWRRKKKLKFFFKKIWKFGKVAVTLQPLSTSKSERETKLSNRLRS